MGAVRLQSLGPSLAAWGGRYTPWRDPTWPGSDFPELARQAYDGSLTAEADHRGVSDLAPGGDSGLPAMRKPQVRACGL